MYRKLENYFYIINKMISEIQLILVNKLLKVVGMFSCNYFFLISKKLGVDRPWPLMWSFFEEILMRKGILESLLKVCMASSCSQIGYPSTVWFCFVYWLPSVYRITMCVICNWVTCWFFLWPNEGDINTNPVVQLRCVILLE